LPFVLQERRAHPSLRSTLAMAKDVKEKCVRFSDTSRSLMPFVLQLRKAYI
jgi:hypothetical protein